MPTSPADTRVQLIVSRAWRASQLCKLWRTSQLRSRSTCNGTKAHPGSVRVHMQSFGAAQNVTLCSPARLLISRAWRASQLCKLMAPKHSRGAVRVHMQSFGAAKFRKCHTVPTSPADALVQPAGCLVSRAWRTSQLCKLMAPKHSRGWSESICKVSELRKMSHYASQPGRSPGAAGWLPR